MSPENPARVFAVGVNHKSGSAFLRDRLFVDEEMLDHATGMRGPSALHAHASGFCENIPGVKIEVENIVATEDAAFGIWNWKGEPTQSMGTSANGNPVFPQRVLSVFRLRDGMLIDYEAFVDAGQVRAQISAP